MKLRALVFSLFVAASALHVSDARAEDPPKQEELPRRQANFAWNVQPKEKGGGTFLNASFSFRDVIDKAMQEKLASGLPQTIAMRAYVLREGETNPVALAVRT